MARIVTKTSEEINRELIEETARITAENLRKTFEESNPRVGESKVTQILRNADKGSSPQLTEKRENKSELDQEKLEEIKRKERQAFEKEKEELEKKLEETEVFCPTCSGGHKHENAHDHKHLLKKTNEGTLKCTGEGCKTEYALIPTDADYQCADCGTPKKKPSGKIDEEDTCPLCHGNEFLKFDLAKVIKKHKKK